MEFYIKWTQKKNGKKGIKYKKERKKEIEKKEIEKKGKKERKKEI